MEATVRQILKTDFDIVQEYCEDIQIQQYLPFLDIDAKKMLQLINKENYQWLVIVLNGIIVGDIIAELDDKIISIAVRVSKKFRKLGYAKNGVIAALTFLKNLGWQFSSIFAAINSDNIASIQFFIKLGFIFQGKDNDSLEIYIKNGN